MVGFGGFAGGVGTLATLLPAAFAFAPPGCALVLSQCGAVSSRRGRFMLRECKSSARSQCRRFRPKPGCAYLHAGLPQFPSPQSHLAERPLTIRQSSAQDSESQAAVDEDRDDHNEMIIEAMEEGAKDFERLESIVEIALDVPSTWWHEVVTKRLDRIADAAALSPGKRVLDVGTGTGTMIPYLTAAGRAKENDVVGVDLSPALLDIASQRYPDATFVEGDVLELNLEDIADDHSDVQTSPSTNTSSATKEAPPLFDAVVLNAVYSLLYDPEATLRKTSELLARGGRLVISHPLGADFVEKLRSQDPVFISHSLPRKKEDLEKLVTFMPLRICQDIVDEEELFLAVMERTPVRALDKVLFLRGPVAAGYGRGGKKLGVPTANLPESLFAGALAAVPAGVYLGWAAVEDGPPVRAVVNVGYSPTFVGEENRQKIVEANLRADMGGDFYGQEMRLMLSGFLRPERRFGSFPELLAAIRQDIADAEAALAAAPFAALARHPFLGAAGRDSAAAAAVPWAQAAQAAALSAGGREAR